MPKNNKVDWGNVLFGLYLALPMPEDAASGGLTLTPSFIAGVGIMLSELTRGYKWF